MIKNIIREVSPEACDFSYYFDDDGMRDYDGQHFDYNLFIIQTGFYGRIDGGLNIEDYKATQERAANLIDNLGEVTEGPTMFGNIEVEPFTYNDAFYCASMEEMTQEQREAIVKWYNADPDINDTDDIADFLTITTGEKWSTTSAHGYCQGDFCEIVYCADRYTEDDAINAGEIYLGAAKEFCVIDLDENGEETDTCYGFIIADNQIKSWMDADSEYKRIVCEWDELNPDETRLEMIDYSKPTITRTIYQYKTIDPEPVTISANLPKAAHTTTTAKTR